MRKVFVAIIALIAAVLMLTGCGSSSAKTAATTGTVAPTATSTPEPAVEKKLPVPREFESDDKTPRFFMEALKKKDPILITFYNDDDIISKEVLAEIKIVFDKYDGTVTFLQLKSDLNAQVSNLADQFSIGFIPYTAVLNRNGTIIFEKTGYIDNKVIEQAVYNAVNK